MARENFIGKGQSDVGFPHPAGDVSFTVKDDRTSKFAFVQLVKKAGKMTAAAFLRDLIEVPPYAIHTILTDNGIQFTNLARHKYVGEHIFDRVCVEHDIDHRLTKLNTHGQMARSSA